MTEAPYSLHFLTQSPLFAPMKLLSAVLPHHWPSLSEFNRWTEAHVTNAEGLPIRFVAQDYTKRKAFEAHYEQRIFLSGEVQTRLHNWHDFFNAACWCLFPKTKACLNQQQYQDILANEQGRRSHRQNVLTQFDECGVIIFCDSPELIKQLRDHQWEQLFWHQRDAVLEHMRFIVFGHALYEKALTPYIGLTGKAVVLTQHPLAEWGTQQMFSELDRQLSDYFQRERWRHQDKPLQPLPILGIPFWYQPQCREFYLNQDYFRPKRGAL